LELSKPCKYITLFITFIFLLPRQYTKEGLESQPLFLSFYGFHRTVTD
jgi:hypothetical protein